MNSNMDMPDQAQRARACEGSSARRGYFDRISHAIERAILVFVVLATMLGNYAAHTYLMRDIIIS